MDFSELIRTRRSLRRYTEQPISQEIVLHLLNMANWAPSAHNRQPWRFAVIRTTATKTRLAAAMGERLRRDLAADGVPSEAIEKDAGRSYARLTGATVLICLGLSMVDMDTYPDEKRNLDEWIMAVQSTAMAGENLLLAAHEAGLGACWMCAPLFCPDVVKTVLELPEDWQPQALITLGYPAEARQKDRKPIKELTLWR